MRVAAFDAKNFDRTKPVEEPDPSIPSKVIKKQKGFFTPLGVGVVLKAGENLVEHIVRQINVWPPTLAWPIRPPSIAPTT